MSLAVAARPAAAAARVRTTHPATFVLTAAIAVWIAVFSVLVWRRHVLFGTIDFDLGIHDQSIWLLSRGHWFTTVRGLPIFGHHASFGYFLLVPFYWLGAGPQFLDLFQVVVLALGAIPLYLLARDRLVSPWAALIPAVVWLLQPSVQWFAWETFHPEVIAIVPVMCAYLAAERKHIGWYWVWIALAIVWKEDLALVVIGLGLLYLIRRRWRLGAATVAVGAIWFASFAMVMVPHLAGGQTVYGPLYGTLGDSPSEVARTAITDPGAVTSRLKDNGAGSYAGQLLAPMAFTPLAAPSLLLLGAPQAVINLLSTANFTWDVRYHYAAIPLLALALGMVEGIAAIDRWFRRRRRAPSARWVVLGVTLAMALFASRMWGPSPLSVRYHDGYWPDTRYAYGTDAKKEAVAAIPTGAPVSADYNLVPHLAHRELVYTFPNPWISSNYGVDGVSRNADPTRVQWIAVNTYVLDVNSRALLDDLIGDGEFVVQSDNDGVLVARRVHPPG